jgi:SAM-dependent methyltransferase
MYRGFPAEMIPLLRCRSDAQELVLEAEGSTAAHVVQGTLSCPVCLTTYRIENGIVRLLQGVSLDAESENERGHRDSEAAGVDSVWELSAYSQMEILPTMEASEPLAGALVLELGAGSGRYTVLMSQRRSAVLAVDFSDRSLENIAARVQPDWRIGLVQADVTQLAVAPGQFDLVASTLVSNLPTLEHVATVFRLAARACKPGGKFVFGVHHRGVRSWLRGERLSGYYHEGHIFRRLFRTGEIERETRRVFDEVRARPIQIIVPLLGRLGVPVVPLSRLLERVPLLNELGELVLVQARRPAVREERARTQGVAGARDG